MHIYITSTLTAWSTKSAPWPSTRARRMVCLLSLPETRGNRKSQFHEFKGDLATRVNFHYLSRSQSLQLLNPNFSSKNLGWIAHCMGACIALGESSLFSLFPLSLASLHRAPPSTYISSSSLLVSSLEFSDSQWALNTSLSRNHWTFL